MNCAGSFGEVFRGIWRGTEVAIKLMLEQDLTVENMQDFCNEISLLRLVLRLVFFVTVVCFQFSLHVAYWHGLSNILLVCFLAAD